MGKELTLSELKNAYENNQNIMKLLREEGSAVNSPLAIRLSYELQTGSYTEGMKKDTGYRESREKNAELLQGFLSKFIETRYTIMEAGVGEATTFAPFARRLKNPGKLYGFDISLSRLFYARKFLKEETGRAANFFTADLTRIPLPDNSVDIVYTFHSIEPNRGREKECLKELYRVTGRVLALVEPAYEFADEAQKKRMDELGYCRGLYDIAKSEGWNVTEHSLWPNNYNPANKACLIIIEKSPPPPRSLAPTALALKQSIYSCPSCGSVLLLSGEHLFCETEGLLFPVIRGIPCLLSSSGILAMKYLE